MKSHRFLAVAVALALCLPGGTAWAQIGGGGGGGGGGAAGGGGGTAGSGGTDGLGTDIGDDIQLQTEILDLANEPVGGITAAEEAAQLLSSTAAQSVELLTGADAAGQQNYGQQRQQARQQFQQGQQGNNQFYMLRPLIRVPANYRRAAAPPVANLSNRMERAIQRSSIAGLAVQVTMEGATAVLRGEATSDRDRTFAATTIRMEPGVGSIRNEIQIVETLQAPPSASDSDLDSDSPPPLLEESILFDDTPMTLD